MCIDQSSSALCVASQEEVDDNLPLCIMEGSTFFRQKKEWELFCDYSLKILEEITEGGFWVCAFGVLMKNKACVTFA